MSKCHIVGNHMSWLVCFLDVGPLSGESAGHGQSPHRDDSPRGEEWIEPTQGQVVEESITKVSWLTVKANIL